MQQKYLQTTAIQRYPVSLAIIHNFKDNENLNAVRLLSEIQSSVMHLPLVVAYSDGQVVDTWLSGPRHTYCTQGVNSANGHVSSIALLPS